MPNDLFGTDGVRGVANADLNCELAFRLGMGAVRHLGPRLAIGRDTRRSGTMLESALVAGIMAAGGTPLCAGVIPTPAVALLTRVHGADGGVVISASHNPPEYNGIKFFGPDGMKATDEVEDALAAYVRGGWEGQAFEPGLGASTACASWWTAPTARAAARRRPPSSASAPRSSRSTPTSTAWTSTWGAARPTSRR